MEYRTDRGAWTRAQLTALGVNWPPESGWITELIGNSITDEQERAFIDARNTRAGKGSKSRPKQQSSLLPITIDSAPKLDPVYASIVMPDQGIHRNKPIGEVPRSYLEWIVREKAMNGFHKVVAEYLGLPEKSSPAPKQRSKKTKKPLDQIESNGVKIDTAVYDCSHLFDPNSPWPDEQQWDGITPPWLDQGGSLDREYRGMFG